MGQYILKTDLIKRIINIELEGTFCEEDGLQSIQAYQQTINPITPSEYELHIDCRRLNVTAPEYLYLLEGCFEMFKRDAFIKIILTIENNPILKMQLARLSRRAELDNLEILSTQYA